MSELELRRAVDQLAAIIETQRLDLLDQGFEDPWRVTNTDGKLILAPLLAAQVTGLAALVTLEALG